MKVTFYAEAYSATILLPEDAISVVAQETELIFSQAKQDKSISLVKAVVVVDQSLASQLRSPVGHITSSVIVSPRAVKTEAAGRVKYNWLVPLVISVVQVLLPHEHLTEPVGVTDGESWKPSGELVTSCQNTTCSKARGLADLSLKETYCPLVSIFGVPVTPQPATAVGACLVVVSRASSKTTGCLAQALEPV